MAKVGYSVALRKNPLKPDEAPKAYAALQTNGTLDIAKLAKHMAQHNSKYSRADITAVMIQMVDCMREKFIEGYKIELGEMGTFSPSISCHAAEKVDLFTQTNIEDYTVNFAPGVGLSNMRPEVEFVCVASRLGQREAAKAEKKANQIIIEGGTSGSEGTEETQSANEETQSANDEENENPVV